MMPNQLLRSSIVCCIFLLNIVELKAQSYGKGAVSAIFDMQGVKISVGGDLDVKYVFAEAGVPEVRLKWNWLQIGWIDYQGTRYSQEYNNIPKDADFGYFSADFHGELSLSKSSFKDCSFNKKARSA